MIMTQSGFAESCVFCIRRSMLLGNQADTEQMLTWSRVSVLEEKNFRAKLQLVCVSMLDVQQINPAPFVEIVMFFFLYLFLVVFKCV